MDLTAQGLAPGGRVRRNLSPAELYEETLRLGIGRLAHGGGLVTNTAPYTGRSPNDRFVVHEAGSAGIIDWGDVNVPIGEEHYARLKSEIIERLNGLRSVRSRRQGGGGPPLRDQRARDLGEPVARPFRLQHVPAARTRGGRRLRPRFRRLSRPFHAG